MKGSGDNPLINNRYRPEHDLENCSFRASNEYLTVTGGVMAYSVGVKSVYYDVMYVLGDHAYEKFEAMPSDSDDDGEPILTWKHNILWWLYQKCIVRSLQRGTFVHSSIHDVDDCRKTIRLHEVSDDG